MIQFNEVSKSVACIKILDKLNLNINDSDFCVISGTNGSGKSTILNLIIGVNKLNKHDSGVIENDFNSISYFPERFVLPSLCTTFKFLELQFGFDIGKNILNSYLSKYSIPNKKIGTLSKGMQQKLILVRTIIKDADLYIFDEPLNGLDLESRSIFFNDLKYLKKKKKTVIVVTHEPEFFNNLYTRFITIDKGIAYEKS